MELELSTFVQVNVNQTIAYLHIEFGQKIKIYALAILQRDAGKMTVN